MKRMMLLIMWISALCPLMAAVVDGADGDSPQAAWPSVRTENKPGTRWWWLGSAVDADNLTWNLEALQQAGIGSVEITPIYGVQGKDSLEIPYLSMPWMDMYKHVQAEGKRLNMIVDMNGGTGWPFGGPNIKVTNAAVCQTIRTYPVKAVRVPGRRGTPKFQTLQVSLETPMDVIKNEGRFPQQLQVLLFVHENGLREHLSLQQVENDTLRFTPASDGTLYALFSGRTGQRVKRAAPGGEGLVMNHLSKDALTHYLQRFDEAFAQSGAEWPHSFFTDSYEVYGANWTDDFIATFKVARGYDISDYLPEFLGQGDPETIERVVCDYRQTLAEMLLNNFTRPWTAWVRSRGATARSQAHGSPGNLLDLYAAVDIPECESFGCTQFDIPLLRVDSNIRRNDAHPSTLKYASSAAHVAGKQYTSSESMTWLTEHFRTSLSIIKPEMDQLFVNGINRVYYHGSPYTPKDAPWPGWLFYASIQVNPNNTIFRDMTALNTYITRVQSFLQQGQPDNELLLYFPIYDIWEKYRKSNYVAFDIHKLGEKLPRFDRIVDDLLSAGYDCDYISDNQLLDVVFEGGTLKTCGGNAYRAILVPDVEVIPVETMRQLLRLAEQGAKVLFLNSIPSVVPGLYQASVRQQSLDSLRALTPWAGAFPEMATEAVYGRGCLAAAPALDSLLPMGGLSCEEMKACYRMDYTRRRMSDGYTYFISMLKNDSVEGWVSLAKSAASVMIFNPLTGEKGLASLRQQDNMTQVYLSLKPGESLILRTFDKDLETASKDAFYPEYQPLTLPKSYLKKHPCTTAMALEGDWTFRFTEGEPVIEGCFDMPAEPVSWTELPVEQAKNYAGTGVYTLTFKLPASPEAEEWLLDFSDCLFESARIRVNGQEAGMVWCAPYQLCVGKYLIPGKKNTIEIAVTNLPANRIADYDRRGVKWRIFKDINLVSVFYKPITFDVWPTVPSGLTAAPRLIPMGRKMIPITNN